jgi:superfamily II DNA or RNA helicase
MFQREGLFSGLQSFENLEARIAALGDEYAKGAAFDVFAEAYFATQRRLELTHVWPLAAVPTDVLRKLALPLEDYGVDGVSQTVLGLFDVYQVKFRSGRTPLTWKGDLSTFFGLSDSPVIQSRVLFANSDQLPAVINQRRDFFCIRGSDLDRLTADDFREIETWLAGSVEERLRKPPKPHQEEALRDLLPALRKQDRVTAVMACGTGKTLLALWIAERMAAQKILVLLPSLALLRQTLHEWLHETSLRSLPCLCVCSDPTMNRELDAVVTSQSDLDFKVSTDSRAVREFLDAPFTGVRVVFSTYQSARVVGRALRSAETFDLGIFDEAHKTAGRGGRNYAFALEDSNLAIRKRVFLTATPRHFNPQRKDAEGDAQLVFSMDKPDVYGPQAYRLTFAEAARRDIICNYKVLFSVITSAMVTNTLLSRGEVVVNGDAIRARQVANQIALCDAIAKYGVKKVFTFHGKVNSAASFVSDGNEGIAAHLPEFKAFHVNGGMTTAYRERLMRDFSAATRGVMSNARCLTEGVDVPAVDMVAFLSPRRSRVDIVQAAGRAMRLAPGKTTGYVLVPLYVEQAVGESVKEAVKRAEFDEIWDVLQSLQEQDDILAGIIREMTEQRGRTGGFDDTRFRERIEVIGPEISLDTLRKAIATSCIDQLGASWDGWFGQLVAFKAKFGRCDPHPTKGEHRRLGNWLAIERKKYRLGKLDPTRAQKLLVLGAELDPYETWWDEMFAKLANYKMSHGHCNVPRDWPEDPALGRWLSAQRARKREGKMNGERVKKMELVGVIWNQVSAGWETRFAELVELTQKLGNPNLPMRYPENPGLAKWLHAQRQNRRRGTLPSDKALRLEQLGVVWSPMETEWERRFLELAEFKKKFGHCNTPRAAPHDGLGKWLSHQRGKKKSGKLEAEKIRRLTDLGVIWDAFESTWADRILELTKFKQRHGHCEVSVTDPQYASLAHWLVWQRKYKRLGKLDSARAIKLEELGVNWDPQISQWSEMFQRFLIFRAQHGNRDPNHATCTNRRLVNWVRAQRQRRKQGKLSQDRINRLDEIGFDWLSATTPLPTRKTKT